MKRVFWAGTGYLVGLGSSVWVQRRVRRTVDRYTPEQVRQHVGQQVRTQAEQVADRTRDLADRARQTVVDLREAAIEGRDAMRESEASLRAEFGGFPSRT
jgi:uncharacterized coiled-coil DUF342 family protein